MADSGWVSLAVCPHYLVRNNNVPETGVHSRKERDGLQPGGKLATIGLLIYCHAILITLNLKHIGVSRCGL